MSESPSSQSKLTTSARILAQAAEVIPGGVNSPVRAYRGVGGTPPIIVRGQGSHLWDADGNEYLDFVGSWGPLILGHAYPQVIQAVEGAARRGTSFGAPTAAEAELARMVVEAVPSVELVRFVSSGTEACMTAIRLARAFTGRDRILKFAGGYHGHADPFLVQAGSGSATLGQPDSAGVPAATAALTITAPYNDAKAVEEAFSAFSNQIAAVIVEPVAANMGVVPPAPGFLQSLRDITKRHGALLIFDEVITGFRVSRGGAQELYGVLPDLTCMGKVIGGGLPVAAVGGRRDIMQLLAPLGPVYQAGTLSGNPLAMAGGIATLKALAEPGVYQRLEQLSIALEQGLAQAVRESEVPVKINRVGSLLTLFFNDQPVTDFATAMRGDKAKFASFFHAMLSRGIYLPPSQYEAWFVSLANTPEEIARTVAAARESLRA